MSSIGLLPFRRYTVANKLMSGRQFKLRSAIVRIAHGQWIILPSAPSTWVFPFGLKEPAVQQHLMDLLNHADAFIDCGANVGWYSFLASRNRRIKAIVAVEPIYESVRFLGFIKRLNRIQHLQIVRGCVSDRDGEVRFFSCPERFSEMGHVTRSVDDVDSQRVLLSQSYTLESILRMVDPSLNRICIKVDVEGHEKALLSSVSADTLAKRVESVIAEVHLYKFSERVEELRRICAFLSPIGRPKFLLLSQELHPGHRRFWWHLTKRYPLSELSVAAVVELIERHSVPEVYVLARRDSVP